MGDRFKEIPGKILEWWNKFTTKQKALLVSSVSVVVIALGILAFALTRPTYVTARVCENTKEAAKVKTLFDDEKIDYKISDDGLTFTVDKKQEADASLLLGENNIMPYTYELDNVFSGGFSLTEADKDKKYQLYMESRLAEQLGTIDVIESAQVQLRIPSDNGTILAQDKESFAGVMLNLSGEMGEAEAAGVAQFVASALGNATTDNILILDSNANVLFSGGDSGTSVGMVSSNLDVKSKAEAMVKAQVKEVVLGSELYSNVSIGMNLNMGFDEKEVVTEEFSPYDPESDRGLVNEDNRFNNSTEGGVAGEPGTGANEDDGTYLMPDGAGSRSETEDSSTKYDNNKRTERSKSNGGDIDFNTSSITVVASTYRIYDEKTLRDNGTLDGTTFEEFKEANEARIKQDVDPELVTMVANATGIPEANISVAAYEVPLFQEDNTTGRSFMDFLPIILASLIMIMLGFVVFRSTRKEPEPVTPDELSVEALLESTKEVQEENLEDIGFSEKSETRILIERFVEENPEAAASLLRNWLNEEWE